MSKDSKIFIFFLVLFGSVISSSNEDKYYFQLYPSLDSDNPHYLYALTSEKLLTINATEGENCKIISSTSVDESTYKNISSAMVINDTYLVKTCFMNNKLVEIVHDKNTFSYNKNLDSIKYCYSSQILNPYINSEHLDKYVIITYYTQVQTGGKYAHNAVLFYPLTNSFSDEFTLKSDTTLIINDYYPENCITLRDTDIYCSIHFTGHSLVNFNLIGNNYVIETDKLFLKDENIFLVVSNTIVRTSNNYKRMISLNRQESTFVATKFKKGMKDIYLTEYQNQEDSIKTWLKYSYYTSDSHLSYIKNENNYGLVISDKYINQNLLNYIAPNQDELLIIYLNHDTKTNLLISRIYTKNIAYNFKGYAINNYYKQDICSNPMYMQSTYINSFINYEEKDKKYMKNNPYNKYYKYEKDIGIVISCKGNDVEFEAIKVEIPQCLNVLDEINGNNLHKLEFNDDKKEIIFDIYNDPNLISFRNASIYFNSSELFSVLITMKIKELGKSDYSSIQYDKEYKNISHIKFVKNDFLPVKSTFKLPYILQFKGKNVENMVNAMQSDLCYLEFSVDYGGNEQKCLVDYCSVCETETFCKVCNLDIPGLILDTDIKSETFGQCICDESRGFLKSPELYKMCICKEGYSFYKGKQFCNITEELKNGTYYEVEIEEKSNITIYDDCPQNCQQCGKNERGELVCLKCFDGFTLKDNECVEGECTSGDWFKLDKYEFKYVKINQCILIFEGGDLFLISDKENCNQLRTMSNYEYIKDCLKDDINETNFLNDENVFTYDSSSEGIIAEKYSEDGRIHFHLVKYNQSNFENISDLLIKNNSEDINGDILIFKADIKRNDTISTQVEYQLYYSDKDKINEKLILTEKNEDLKVFVYVPVTLSEDQLTKLKELKDQGINIFDSSSPFYLDVCHKFTTQNKEDMFLEDRKKEYYINESFCESGCNFKEYDYNTKRALCECEFKENTENYDKVTFVYKEVHEKYKKRIKAPNLVAMKCTSQVNQTLNSNLLFFITLFLLLIFVAFFVFAIIKGQKKLQEEFKIMTNILEEDKEDKEIPDSSDKDSQKSGSTNQNPEIINQPEQNIPFINGKEVNIYKTKEKRNISNQNRNINEKNIIPSSDGSEDDPNKNVNDGRDSGFDNTKINNPNNSSFGDNNSQKNKNNGFEFNNINIDGESGGKNENDPGNGGIYTGNVTGKDDKNKNNPETITIQRKNPEPEEGKEEEGKEEEKKEEEKKEEEEGKEEEEEKEEEEKKKEKKKKGDKNGKKDLISQNRSIRQSSRSFEKMSESIIKSSKNQSYTRSDVFPKISYSRDLDENKEDKAVSIEEINFFERKVKNEEFVKDSLFFNQKVVEEINSSFTRKVVKVNTLFSKDDKKKKDKHKDNKANPPGKKVSQSIAGSKERFFDSGPSIEFISDDYISDKKQFKQFKEEGKNDERNILSLLLSVIQNNSTIILVFFKKHYEDLFVRASFIILFISLYLCINTFLLYEMPMVKLFTGGCTFGNLVLNIFVTSLVVNVLMIIIKKYMSTKELIYELIIQNELIIKKKENIQDRPPDNEYQAKSVNSELGHNLSDKTIRYRKTWRKRILIYGDIGVLFLIFNCILVTSFCGIYPNSVGELILNTFVSMILSSIIIRILFFLIGVILRYYSFKRNSEIMYNISRLFNPLNLSMEEFEAMDFSGIYKICEKKPEVEKGNIEDRPANS